MKDKQEKYVQTTLITIFWNLHYFGTDFIRNKYNGMWYLLPGNIRKISKMDKGLAFYPASLSPNKKLAFGGQKLHKSGYQSFPILLKFHLISFLCSKSTAQYCSNQEKFHDSGSRTSSKNKTLIINRDKFQTELLENFLKVKLVK